MGQLCSRRTSRLLGTLLLSGLVMGGAQAQAPKPSAATPTPAVSPTPAASKPAGPTVETPEPPDKVVLKVGDEHFTKADIDFLIANLPPQTQQAIAAQGKKQLGDYYALTVMLSRQAQLHHSDQTSEFARKMAFQKQQLEAQTEMNQQTKITPEELQQYYTVHAANYDEIMVRQIVIRKKAAEPKANVDTPAAGTPLPTVRLGWVGPGEAIVRAKLEKNPQVSALMVQAAQAVFKFAGSDEELSALLAGLVSAGLKVLNFDETKPAHPTAATVPGLAPEEAKARAEAIRKELVAGADIKKVTEDFKAPGDVIIEPEPRKVRRGGMRPDMEKVAFALKDGEVSEPVDVVQALVFFQVTGRSHIDLKDVMPEIEKKLRQEKADAAVAEIKKNNPVWMDEQYFAAPPKPQEGPTLGAPSVKIPPKP